jgi:hypothetical protein
MIANQSVRVSVVWIQATFHRSCGTFLLGGWSPLVLQEGGCVIGFRQLAHTTEEGESTWTSSRHAFEVTQNIRDRSVHSLQVFQSGSQIYTWWVSGSKSAERSISWNPAASEWRIPFRKRNAEIHIRKSEALNGVKKVFNITRKEKLTKKLKHKKTIND